MSVIGGHERGGVGLPLAVVCMVHFLWRILCAVLNWYSTALTSPFSAAAEGLSSTPTTQSTTTLQHLSTAEGTALLTRDPLTAFSSQQAHTMQDVRSTAHTSTVQPQSESLNTATTQPTTTGHPLTSAPGRGPAVPTHWEVPSELNVGDEGQVIDNRESIVFL